MSLQGHIRKRRRLHNLIAREGQVAILRGTEGDRSCLVMEDAFNPSQIDGTLIQMGDRRFFMSPLFNTDSDELIEVIPPTSDDRLVLEDPDSESGELELIMASNPGRAAPSTVVIYYELHCRAP